MLWVPASKKKKHHQLHLGAPSEHRAFNNEDTETTRPVFLRVQLPVDLEHGTTHQELDLDLIFVVAEMGLDKNRPCFLTTM